MDSMDSNSVGDVKIAKIMNVDDTETSLTTTTSGLPLVEEGLQHSNNDENDDDRGRRHVHWSPFYVQIYDHLHVRDFTVDEKSSYWFSNDEFTEMMNHPMTQIFLLKQIVRRGFASYFTNNNKKK